MYAFMFFYYTLDYYLKIEWRTKRSYESKFLPFLTSTVLLDRVSTKETDHLTG
jgi:hypothetical protein